ncbi:cytidine deaminase [Flavobacteriaceae bacterium MAR_2009_75]|nr:cytidine deaminase [Flavobacteriaceae bacterium MAR_2009_75]
MKKEKIEFELTIFDGFDELSDDSKYLMNQAVEARRNAYAPYSKFQVGAAVLLENDEIIIGNNQENASYPSGLCAERVAMFYAGAKYPGVVIKSVAITATSKNYQVQTAAAPCGNCRQAMSEYEVKQKSPIKVLLMGESGPVYQCDSIADILPLGFDSSYL